MTPEHESHLVKTYPRLFAFHGTRGFLGLSCGDGWFGILDALCGCLSSDSTESPRVVQIKEKFGTLRFYLDEAGSQYVTGLIQMAEAMSARVCEECGAPGRLWNLEGGCWVKTLCDACEASY